jgi:PAS domain S-box-containing protein
VNQAFLDMFGYGAPDEIVGKHRYFTVHPDDRERVTGYAQARQKGGYVPPRHEFKGIRKDGTPIDIDVSASMISYRGEKAILAYLRDITEHKKADEQIRASLREKEVLLKEIHHRVKNNLQVMSSLLNLQSQYLDDEKALDIFRASMDRIKTMALIHDKLYRSESLSRIYFPAYVNDLTRDLFNTYGMDKGIYLNLDVGPVSFNIDTAIPLGLIINELVSNALKHAFSGMVGGTIRVGLYSENSLTTLVVSDTGIGFPEDLDFMDTPSMGMQLVVTLVEQLEGTIELNRDRGTEFRITFEAGT